MSTALVTGAGGFIGGAVARLLVERGWTVRSLARGSYPQLAAAGIETRRGDLADPRAVDDAVAGCDAVFHVAARAGVGGPRRAYATANIDGTQHVLAACSRHGVARLVHTSTPSVVHAGRDLHGVDESVPVPARHRAAYPATKAVAERLVLAADGGDLATVALRPHLVWGPGDNHLVPGIVARARSGRLRLVGDGAALVDATYIDNAALAHVLAAEALTAPDAPARGRAYFIANGEPTPVGQLVDGILAAAGLPPAKRGVPLPLALAAGAVAEAAWRLAGRDDDPPVTRFLARQLATAHWFDLGAARRDLGYVPQVSTAEGLRRLAEHLRAADR